MKRLLISAASIAALSVGYYAYAQTTQNCGSVLINPLSTDEVTVECTPFTPANQPPVAVDDTASGNRLATITGNVLTNDTDPNAGDTLTVSAAPQGNIAPNGAFSVQRSQEGVYVFNYTVSDGNGGTDDGVLTITVLNQNPVANPDSQTITLGQTATGNVLTNDTDPENDTLTETANADIAADGSYSITPSAVGTVVHNYSVSDGHGGSASSTLTIVTNAPANQNPVAVDDEINGNIPFTATGNVLTNDSDPDGGTLSVQQPNANINSDGSFSIQHNTQGQFDYPYTVLDGQGGSDTGNLRVNATQTPPPTGAVAFIDPTNGNVPFPRATRTDSDEARKLAFPSAEGYGKFADPDIGPGQTFTIHKVTNLNDSGAGSFRACWTATGPRVCIFTVSGTITQNSSMLISNPNNSNVYVAGQTSPGGVQVKLGPGAPSGTFHTSHVSDMVVRYMRGRPGVDGDDSTNVDSIGNVGGQFSAGSWTAHDIIFDHMSAQWGLDEGINLNGIKNGTVQWSIQSEPINCSVLGCRGSGGGSNHDYGVFSVGNESMSMHHNLFMDGRIRNPNVAANAFDLTNNVVYNYSNYQAQAYATNVVNNRLNMIANWMARGPKGGTMSETGDQPHCLLVEREAPPVQLGHEIYVSGNRCAYDLTAAASQDQIAWLEQPVWTPDSNGQDPDVMKSSPVTPLQVTPTTADQAFKDVVAFAGARIDRRGGIAGTLDTVDQRAVDFLTSCGGNAVGLTDIPAGGYPTLSGTWTWVDSDNDGMHDPWEQGHVGNLTTLTSNGDFDSDGWGDLEEFLNYLAGENQTMTGAGTSSVPAPNCGRPGG